MIPEARAHNWATFPVWGITERTCRCPEGATCSSPGKHPIPARGVHEATVDEQKLDRWAKQHPGSNIGVATGRPSRIAVVDVDPKHGGPASYEQLRKRIKLAPTLRALTGSGGWHDYYAAPDGCPTMRLADGIDLRGDGAYVVAPHSVHVTGNAYKWLNELDIAPLPEGLVTAAERRQAEPMPDKIRQGQRESTLVSLAGSMRRRAATSAEILAAIQVANSRCEPPLEQKDLERIARSVGRYLPEPTKTPETATQPGRDGTSIDDEPELLSMQEFAATVGDYDYGLDYLGPMVRGGERLSVIGPIGQGKTTFTLEAIEAVLSGSEFLGFRGAGRVRACYAALEMPGPRLQKAFESARLHTRDDFVVWRQPQGLQIDKSERDRQMIHKVCERFDVVAIDPWYRLVAEEVSEGMKNVPTILRFLSELKERHPRTAVIIGFHSQEPRGRDRLGGLGDASGYKVFQRDSDTAVVFQRTPGTNRSTLTWAKCRADYGLPALGTRWMLEWQKGRGFERIEQTPAWQELLAAVPRGQWFDKYEAKDTWERQGVDGTYNTLLKLVRMGHLQKRAAPRETGQRGGSAPVEFFVAHDGQETLTG